MSLWQYIQEANKITPEDFFFIIISLKGWLP